MAKVFAGFTPEQLGKIDPSLEGKQSDEQQKIIAANPALSARIGQMSTTAQKLMLAAGGYIKGYATGGTAAPPLIAHQYEDPSITGNYDLNITNFDPTSSGMLEAAYIDPARINQQPAPTLGEIMLSGYDSRGGTLPSDAGFSNLSQNPLEINPGLYEDPRGIIPDSQSLDQSSAAPDASRNPAVPVTTPSSPSAASTMTAAITADPKKLTVKASPAQTTPEAIAAGQIAAGTGQAPATAPQATTTAAAPAQDAQTAPAQPAAQVQAKQVTPLVEKATADMQAAQGQVSEQAQMQAAQGDPTKLAQLGVQAAQGQAATVQGAPTRTLDQAELVSGSTVDQSQVAGTFGTGEVKAASVRDEMASLMSDFQGTEPPAWAAGAMRNAAAQMAARGLGASSMAGQAIVQSAMEAALPIAQMDASNKQQMALFKAEQRAKFMGQEFDQNFQTKVINASKISEVANMNFNAEQQVALENAKMAQTMNLANLSNRQAKVMADVATMAQMDMANLNNRQQAQVQNAQAFLQMDMTNISNEQQMAMFKSQERVNAILSDQAAENAAKQFNATSENQTNQFFSSLATQVSQFNTEQKNAMQRFNAGEANAIGQFNAAQQAARDQFNSQNQLVIAQANAQWAQSITTAENAAANQANRDAALAANNFTMTAYNNLVQRERDTLAWAWQSAENEREVAGKIAVAKIDATKSADTKTDALSAASGKFLAAVAEQGAKWIFENI